ncbi:CLUMA_CG010632, isoform A [Clunio marinus]|uniref:CLUMA_CG010632, isoform A n=1 Tax=Clunio marinus TaxID=568069 RepID=A0A1J1ICF8_9DIPT|nr:CLUMA_CG010632, isoform A [Clunio marinus]
MIALEIEFENSCASFFKLLSNQTASQREGKKPHKVGLILNSKRKKNKKLRVVLLAVNVRKMKIKNKSHLGLSSDSGRQTTEVRQSIEEIEEKRLNIFHFFYLVVVTKKVDSAPYNGWVEY